MRVSVAITTYNAADYLREAIQSALAQTHRPEEVVVVDDGSTDHTREVCASFGPVVKYFYQPKAAMWGGSVQLRAILETSGELIAFLDHDDRWLPEKLEKQLKALESNPEAGAVFTAYRHIDKNGGPIGEPIPSGPSGDVFHELLKGCPYCHSSAMVRRSALARGGLQDIDSIIGDWDQWLRIARYHRVVAVEECLTEYRVYENSFSGDRRRVATGMRQILRRHKNRLHPNCRECRKALRKSRSLIRQFSARYSLDRYHGEVLNGRFFSALPFLWQAVTTSPAEILRPRRFLAVVKNGFQPTIRALKNGNAKSVAR